MKKKKVILFLSVMFFSIFAVHLILAQTSQTAVNFTTGTFTCENNATTAVWIDSTTNQRFVVGSSPTTCSTYSHESIPSCCPTSLSHCNTTSNSCEDSSRITDCTKYKSQSDCEADDQNVGVASIANSSNCGLSSYFSSGGEICVNLTSCGCFWDSSTKCSAKKKYTLECPDGSSHRGTCTWSTFSITNEDCSNSVLPVVVSSTASWAMGTLAQPADCSDITRSYPCVSTAQLPFFTLSSLIVSSLSIIFIYLFLLRFNKK
jgi:hypothetical protein